MDQDELLKQKLEKLEREVKEASKADQLPASVKHSSSVSGPEPKKRTRQNDKPASGQPNTWIFWLVAVLSVLISTIPQTAIVFAPINTFVTLVHEMGHAIVCVLTGGTVSGLTIVGDGAGHGGLTFCQGGIPFFYSQTGYLGTAFFGCLLIFLGQYPRLSKPILTLMGVSMALASIFWVLGTLLRPDYFLQAIFSLLWALAISGAFIFLGRKLSQAHANLLLLFVAVQTALNSLSQVWILLQGTSVLGPAETMSDATNMQAITGIPAIVWSVAWVLISIAMIVFTLKITYVKRTFNLSKQK